MQASIIIDNYNYARFLKQCIDSSLNQNTSTAYEILLVDDQSTDDSLQIATQYLPEITILKTTGEKSRYNGINQLNAFRLGINASKSDILIFLDSDDMICPEKVSAILEIFQTNPHVNVVSHSNYEIDENGFSIGSYERPVVDFKGLFKTGAYYPVGVTSCLAVKRSYILSNLDFFANTAPHCWIDFKLSQTAAIDECIVTRSELLTKIRRHASSDSRSMRLPKFLHTVREQYTFVNAALQSRGRPLMPKWVLMKALIATFIRHAAKILKPIPKASTN